MLALTALRPGDVLPGRFDVDFDCDTYFEEGFIQIEVYPLLRDDLPGTIRTDFRSLAIVDVPIPAGAECFDADRYWFEVLAGEPHDAVLDFAPDWSHAALRGVVNDAVDTQMALLRGGVAR